MTLQTSAVYHAGLLPQLRRRYAAGFVTDIETDSLPPGLDEGIIRALSARKNEPEWMTQWRLSAYRHWLTMPAPHWAKLEIARTTSSLKPGGSESLSMSVTKPAS
jgi:Fe-S cluster assembly protein SufB